MDTDAIMAVATVMAARELLPASPSDLTHILRDPAGRAELLNIDPLGSSSDLIRYLCERLDLGRRDWWFKSISAIVQSAAAFPTLAATPDYPARLEQCWDAPPVLFTNRCVPDIPSVAIVGSRETTDDALSDTFALARTLAHERIAVVSGLAAGVDTQAHRGALAAGGVTLAVLGTGIQRVFPVENGPLAEQIRRSGVLISQFPPDAPRTGTTFLYRNHVIAGLSDASVVIDGRNRSGSRHEIEQAIGYGRPALLWEPVLGSQAWAREFVDSGKATFVRTADDVLHTLEVTS